MSSHPPFFANAQVMALDPAEIFVPDRIGFYHEDKATALGRLIAVDGQRDPIKVQPRKGNQAMLSAPRRKALGISRTARHRFHPHASFHRATRRTRQARHSPAHPSPRTQR